MDMERYGVGEAHSTQRKRKIISEREERRYRVLVKKRGSEEEGRVISYHRNRTLASNKAMALQKGDNVNLYYTDYVGD